MLCGDADPDQDCHHMGIGRNHFEVALAGADGLSRMGL